MTPERRLELLSATNLGRLVAFGHEQPPDPVGSPPVTFGFNPDQERAANGKFGSGGGGGNAGADKPGLRDTLKAPKPAKEREAGKDPKAAKKKPTNPSYGRDIRAEEEAKSEAARNDPRTHELTKQYKAMSDKTDAAKAATKPDVAAKDGGNKHAVVGHLFAAMGKNKEMVKHLKNAGPEFRKELDKYTAKRGENGKPHMLTPGAGADPHAVVKHLFDAIKKNPELGKHLQKAVKDSPEFHKALNQYETSPQGTARPKLTDGQRSLTKKIVGAAQSVLGWLGNKKK